MAANQPVRGFSIRWQEKLSPAHFVKLEQHNREGKLLSENFYWRGVKNEDLQQLGRLPRLELDGQAKLSRDANRALVTVDPKNSTAAVALMAKATLRKGVARAKVLPAIADREIGDSRVLPAFASVNYVSLLPGEEKQLTIECAAEDLGNEPPIVTLDGWIIARQCSR